MNKPQPIQLQNLLITGFPPREGLVVGYTALGLCSKRIAREINCTPRNVENLRESAKGRLHAHNTPHLISKAFQSGFLRFLSLMLITWLGTGLQPVLAEHFAIDSDEHLRRQGRSSRNRGRSRTQGRRNEFVLLWDPDLGRFIADEETIL